MADLRTKAKQKVIGTPTERRPIQIIIGEPATTAPGQIGPAEQQFVAPVQEPWKEKRKKHSGVHAGESREGMTGVRR